MSWLMAIGMGAGLGLAYYGALWLTVRQVVSRPSMAVMVPASSLIRFILLAIGLMILGRHGPGRILAALGGLWLSRGYLLHRLGGARFER
jgi:F1F0 ATPase subunit 2